MKPLSLKSKAIVDVAPPINQIMPVSTLHGSSCLFWPPVRIALSAGLFLVCLLCSLASSYFCDGRYLRKQYHRQSWAIPPIVDRLALYPQHCPERRGCINARFQGNVRAIVRDTPTEWRGCSASRKQSNAGDGGRYLSMPLETCGCHLKLGRG